MSELCERCSAECPYCIYGDELDFPESESICEDRIEKMIDEGRRDFRSAWEEYIDEFYNS